MKKAYIVIQGKSYEAAIESILPRNMADDVLVTEGTSQSSAISLAASILIVKQRPVALIVDAGTTDADDIQTQKYVLRDILYRASPGIPFEVFLAAPEMEVLFLQDRRFIEKIANRKFSDTEWQDAALHPKKFLSDLLKQDASVSAKLLEKIDDEAVRNVQAHPLLRNVCNFLSSVIDGKN